MATETEIKKIISESFLSQKQKTELLNEITKSGTGVSFFAMFNKYLKDGIVREGTELKKTLSEIDKLERDLDNRITEEKKRIEKNMEEELGSLTASDERSKDRIWDEYYDNLERLEKSYEKGVKEILNKISKQL